jgi:hypothetical protein
MDQIFAMDQMDQMPMDQKVDMIKFKHEHQKVILNGKHTSKDKLDIPISTFGKHTSKDKLDIHT